MKVLDMLIAILLTAVGMGAIVFVTLLAGVLVPFALAAIGVAIVYVLIQKSKQEPANKRKSKRRR